ncbi:MAG: porin family protein [Nitrosomonadales bacterium]|nr:porin family protein [Nitrosomonadales bacterium]
MKKILLHVALVAALLCSTATYAANEVEEFLGAYYGGRIGINNSKATGAISAPGESTIAYIMQGGYLQGGYNWKFGKSVIGAGGYADLHGFEKHSNDVAYGGHAWGLDARWAMPIGPWLPYAKLGFGYSAATGDLRAVSQFGLNKAVGGEYKYSAHWSAVAEYKINRFQGNSTVIENKTFLLGVNYYMDEPAVVAEVVKEEEFVPLPVVPETPPEFAPPP